MSADADENVNNRINMAASNTKSDHVIADITEKIAFASYLPLLTRATTDNTEATPGYMIAEIEKLTYDFPHHNKQLASYLSRRLEKPSAQVKLKVLKIMDHIIREGHVNVRIALRRNDSSIKMTTMYNGVPDPLTGTSMYEKIRTDSKTLLELLFLPERIQEDEKQLQESGTVNRPQKPYLGAMGSNTTNEGKYQGFGNSPRMKEESVTEKVLGYFDRFSMSNDQNSKIIREGIASSVGKYEAVSMPDHQFIEVYVKPMPAMPPQPRPSSAKTHIPGKAGGGWEDSEDEIEETFISQHASIASANSLENVDLAQPENSTERDLVQKFCSDEKCPMTWKELSSICTRCNQLSGSEALLAIVEVLQTCEQKDVLRALTLLDALLHTELLATSRAVSEANHLLNKPLASICINTNIPELHKNKAEKILEILNKRLLVQKS